MRSFQLHGVIVAHDAGLRMAYPSGTEFNPQTAAEEFPAVFAPNSMPWRLISRSATGEETTPEVDRRKPAGFRSAESPTSHYLINAEETEDFNSTNFLRARRAV